MKSLQEGEDGTLASREEGMLGLFADEPAIVELSILWADFGQRIDNVRGVINEVLPSRLRELEEANFAFQKIEHPAFPEYSLDEFRIKLSLSFLLALYRRPGGKKAKKENESKRLFDLRRSLVAAIFHGRNIEATRTKKRFDDEIMKTAKWHLLDLMEDGQWGNLTYEGWSKRKKRSVLNFRRMDSPSCENPSLLKNDWSIAYASH